MYRLPTEAQWEYACRAGEDSKWCFGNEEEELQNYAWYGEDSSKGSAHPVAHKRPNAWGFYDMHGNVWEWCQNWSGAYEASSQDDPPGPATGSRRVCRGGCWSDSAWYCRSASRYGYSPARRYNSLGFRLALVPSSQDK